LIFDLYIYNLYDYKDNEDNNIIINLFENIRKYLEFFFKFINKIYIKTDKYLFRMERKKKFKMKLADMRVSI
jgi:hypothetical protein